MLGSQQAGFSHRLSDWLFLPPLKNTVQTFIYFIKTIRYFMPWTSGITHYQNYKYLCMPVATQRHTYVYVIFAPAFAFLSHLLLYYPFHMDNSFHHIQKWAKVVTKEEKAWLTFIQYLSRTLDSWTLMTTRRVYAFIPSEEKCIYTGGY